MIQEKVKKSGVQDGKKRVPYTNDWRAQVVKYESKTNPARDDYQDESNKIRPKETIYKERPQPDYSKSKTD